MTLQASGAISLSDIKNEHGGGSTNIALGNYKKQIDNADGFAYYVVSWTGHHFQVAGTSPSTTSRPRPPLLRPPASLRAEAPAP